MRAILAAIDFSRLTDLVVMEAARLARGMGAKVVLVTVLVEPVIAQGYAPPARSLSKLLVAHERGVRKRLAAIQDRLQREFVTAETVVRHGNPAVHIVEEAEEHDAAFLVIGSHSHTAFFEFLLGSTTQAVLKRATLPVVVIPPTMRRPRRAKVRLIAAAEEEELTT